MSVDQDFLRGLVYTHNRANANTAELHKLSATLEAIVEILTNQGLLDRSQLEERFKTISDILKQRYIEQGMAVAMQEFSTSKYEFQGGAEIDCENRIQLCKAACCRLPFALSREDVKEGVVKWDAGQPYLNARDENGYCIHLQNGTCRCSIYDQRPIPCRGYDCRKDKRIWLDFQQKIVNPGLSDPDWPECTEEKKL